MSSLVECYSTIIYAMIVAQILISCNTNIVHQIGVQVGSELRLVLEKLNGLMDTEMYRKYESLK